MNKGEGSRGGKVIGRTKSGKPIYASTGRTVGRVVKGAAKDAASSGASAYAYGRIFKHTHAESLEYGVRGAAVFGAVSLGIRSIKALNNERKKRNA